MRCLYKLRWSEGDDKWHFLCPMNDAFIMDIPDCENFRRQANNPDKSRERLIVVEMHWIDEDTPND